MSMCPRCATRGKTSQGSDPKCAFPDGVFTGDNWNCATMNVLRKIADIHAVYCEDEYAALLPYPDSGSFIVLKWYKRRGKTDIAAMLDGFNPITIGQADAVIATTEARPC
jgi:hypothetical protein